LTSLNVPADILAVEPMASKTIGFKAFKATTKFRLMVNAERFMAGRIIMSFVPVGAMLGQRHAVTNNILQFVTQRPRVELDLSTDTECTLEVPYVNALTHYDLQTGEGSFGYLFINVYSPLVSVSGPSSVKCQLWTEFSDIDLAFPARPQSVRTGRKKRNLRLPSEVEASELGVGPVSSVLGAVSRASTVLTSVPLLAPYAMPLAWATNLLSNVASAFGWSNPTSSAAPKKVTVQQFAYSANCNGVDNSQSLALLSDAQVSNLPQIGGTNVDEMDINYICQIPSFVDAYTWDDTSSINDTIFQFQVTPSLCHYHSFGSNTLLYPTPMAYMCSAFTYWRGSINYHFKFVKTEFHSGRLLFTFDPGSPTAVPNVANTAFLYREILDLRVSNEFTVTVPYVSVQPYLKVSEYTGSVRLQVLNSLVAPSTVSSSIEILFEVSAGPDFELSVPCPLTYVPIYPQSLHYAGLDLSPQALGTGVLDDGSANIAEPSNLFTGDTYSGGLVPSMLCIGEKIKSIRQLLKRSVPYISGNFGSIRVQGICPSLISVQTLTSTGTPVGYPPDYYNFFSVLYAFRRGGTRIRFYNVNSAATSQKFAMKLDINTVGRLPLIPGSTGSYPAPGVVYSTEGIQGGIEATIPYYSRTPLMVNKVYYNNSTTSPVTIYEDELSLTVRSSNVLTDCHILRQVSDDFALGYFIGTLPIIAAGAYPAYTQVDWA
jgi:hypothetical protein